MSNPLEHQPHRVAILVNLITMILEIGLALGILWISKRLEAKRYVEASLDLQYLDTIKHPKLLNKRTELIEQAITKYRKAIALAPNWAEPRYYLADIDS